MDNIIRKQSEQIITELLEASSLKPGGLFVIGCSSSEVIGGKIGKNSSFEAACDIFDAVYPILYEKGIYLAAQCCEHLNRALVLEEEAAIKFGYEPVRVIPQPKAGGSFATAAYRAFKAPVVVEHIKADAGIDIGETLIGMHLKDVAVPFRPTVKNIGKANIICAYSRPKYIGGTRAVYE